MEYGTFTAAPKQPEQQPPSATDGISAGGVLTLVLAVAVTVVIKRAGRRGPAPRRPPKNVTSIQGDIPTVTIEDLRGEAAPNPEPDASGDESGEEKGGSVLSAPAVKVWAHRLDIPYELAQRLQKSSWSAMCKARRLAGLERGDVEKTPYGVAVHVKFRGSLDFPAVQRGIGQIETGLDTGDGAIRLRKGQTAGRGILDVRLRDPLADGVPWEQPSAPVRLAHPVRLAVTPFGDTVELNVKQRIGIFGTSGSGKSCAQRLIGAHVAQAIDADLEIWDLKFGVESQHYQDKAYRVTEVADAVDRVEWLLNVEYPRRAAKMRDRSVSEWNETPWDPARVIIIDEGNVVIRGFSEWRGEGEDGTPSGVKGLPLKDLFTLVEQGRALGVYFVWATQYPKAASLPTEIRSQLNATVCLKLRTDGESRVVFGDDVSEGWAPHDLFGPGWLLVQDNTHNEPVDAKAVWLSVDTFRSVPVSGPSPDKPALVSRTPGQSLSQDSHERTLDRAGQDTDSRTESGHVSLDKGRDTDSRTDVATDVWLVLSVCEAPQGVSELARRTGRSKSAVFAALKRMVDDGRLVQYGAGYRLRTTGEK